MKPFVTTHAGVTHLMLDEETTACGKRLEDGVRKENPTRLGRCELCRKIKGKRDER